MDVVAFVATTLAIAAHGVRLDSLHFDPIPPGAGANESIDYSLQPRYLREEVFQGCMRWAPIEGSLKEMGDVCNWHLSPFPWCWVHKDYRGPWKMFMKEHDEYPDKFYAPCLSLGVTNSIKGELDPAHPTGLVKRLYDIVGGQLPNGSYDHEYSTILDALDSSKSPTKVVVESASDSPGREGHANDPTAQALLADVEEATSEQAPLPLADTREGSSPIALAVAKAALALASVAEALSPLQANSESVTPSAQPAVAQVEPPVDPTLHPLQRGGGEPPPWASEPHHQDSESPDVWVPWNFDGQPATAT
eukprot:TRINITY_DN76422_c0_g1_i1.p1 TRINITY_DN76422_c0_g1~~TRINITY_DN76422_c0_g1_i1.p1  ORF type:complete len:306 (-),score=36.32 TRINITY_DN76422_c0_g1_i1:161-1078(-)